MVLFDFTMNLKGQCNPLNDFKGFRVNEIVFEWDYDEFILIKKE